MGRTLRDKLFPCVKAVVELGFSSFVTVFDAVLRIPPIKKREVEHRGLVGSCVSCCSVSEGRLSMIKKSSEGSNNRVVAKMLIRTQSCQSVHFNTGHCQAERED